MEHYDRTRHDAEVQLRHAANVPGIPLALACDAQSLSMATRHDMFVGTHQEKVGMLAKIELHF